MNASGTLSAQIARYPIEALLRGAEPGRRACADTRDLVQLARYMAEGAGVRLVFHSTAGSGRVNAWIDVFGPDADALSRADLAHACGLSVVLGAREAAAPGAAPTAITHAHELTRIVTAPMFTASAEDLAYQPDWLTQTKTATQLAFAQPKPSLDCAAELLAAISRSPREVWVVTTIVPPIVLEQRLVLDEMDAFIGRDARAEYSGAIVCARTVVASSGPVSPAVLAGLARRSPEVEATPIDPAEVRLLWEHPTAQLRGRAVAEGHAIALTRVPSAAGAGNGLGIPTRHPEPDARPLDPLLREAAAPVRLGHALDVAGEWVDVAPDVQDLRRHLYVEGKSGAGKSAFLKSAATSWLETGHPLIVLDPHGDVAESIGAQSLGREGRPTFFIRHGDVEHPIGLNPLSGPDADARAQNVDALLDHMQRVMDPGREGMFGDRAKRTFSLVAEAAAHVYGSRLTIQVVQTLLLRQRHVQELARRVRVIDPDIARRLMAELGELGDKEWTDLISWFQSRFQMWHRTRALRDITGMGVDAVDMLAVLDGRANLIVDLASPQLGDAVAGILGGIYLRKLRDTMGRRADPTVPVLVAFDEAHLFQDEAPDRLLAEGRKYGLALMIASQSTDNLTPRLARAIEANVGSFVSLRTGLNGAPAASARLGGWPAGDLTRLPDLTAAVSLSSRGIPTDAFTMHVDHFGRLADQWWTADRIARAARVVADTTVSSLWLPYSDRTPLSDDAIIAALASSAAGGAPAQAEPRPAVDERSEVDRVLDGWQVARLASVTDEAASDPSSANLLLDLLPGDTWPR